MTEATLEVLTFEVAGQRCGVALADVREIIPAIPPIPLPGAPAAVEGVINLRGRVIPVLDLRRRLGLPLKPLEHTDHFVIARALDRLIALRVDRAVGLARVNNSDVDDLRDIIAGDTPARIARLSDGLVLLQDLRALLSRADSATLAVLLPAPEGGGA